MKSWKGENHETISTKKKKKKEKKKERGIKRGWGRAVGGGVKEKSGEKKSRNARWVYSDRVK